MAISEDLPGVEVAISVAGNDLKEYVDPDLEEEERTTTRYVEAVDGQQFAIRLKVSKRFDFVGDTLRFRMMVDGRWVATPLVSKHRCRYKDKEDIQLGERTSPRTLRRFEFSALETVADGCVHISEAAQLKHLGTIQVKVEHRMRTGRRRNSTFANAREIGIVSEKALKGQAISHSVRLAEPESCPGKNRRSTMEIPGHEAPVARFVFKYRSLENLKIERILPRTPTPPPLQDRDLDTLGREELREMQKRLKELENERESKVKIKREVLESEERRRRKVARPSANSTILEMDEAGDFRAGSTSTSTVAEQEQEVIVLD